MRNSHRADRNVPRLFRSPWEVWFSVPQRGSSGCTVGRDDALRSLGHPLPWPAPPVPVSARSRSTHEGEQPNEPVVARPARRPSRRGARVAQGFRPQGPAAIGRTARRRARGPDARGRAGRVRRDPRSERLGQVDARPAALDAPARPTAASAKVFGYDVVRQDKAVRRLVNRVSVEACFFKKMSPSENLRYAARFYGMTLSETRDADPRDPRAGRLPARAARRADGEPLARDAAEGRARASAAHVARACSCSTSRPPVSTRARSSRCRSSSARCGRCTTRRSSSARTTSARRSPLADRVGILDRGELLALEPADALKAPLRRRDARGGVLRGHGPRLLDEEDELDAGSGRCWHEDRRVETENGPRHSLERFARSSSS